MDDSSTNLGPNPSGLCMCGCGGKTPVAKHTSTADCTVRGLPIRFISGHGSRKSPVEYVEQDCGYATHCWVWQRACDSRGYGHAVVAGSLVGAHRMYWEREHGPIPSGTEVNHLCFNPLCVNPAHLEVVTHAVNCRRRKHMKLTEAQVAELRAEAATMRTYGRAPLLAAKYGIRTSYAQQIIGGWKWREES